MSKIAFVFPGQGAQYFGMGKDFYESSEDCRRVFDRASEITGIDMKAFVLKKMTGSISRSIHRLVC